MKNLIFFICLIIMCVLGSCKILSSENINCEVSTTYGRSANHDEKFLKSYLGKKIGIICCNGKYLPIKTTEYNDSNKNCSNLS